MEVAVSKRRTVTKKGKDYQEAYYQYEFWSQGDRIIKSSKYIPKRLLDRVQELDAQKAPVREILKLLGVTVWRKSQLIEENRLKS